MSAVAVEARRPEAGAGGSGTGCRKVEGYIRAMGQIDGWLSQAEARCFVALDAAQKAMDIRGDLVEIGVWQGRGAILFHHLLRADECVHAVDIFDLRDRDHPYFNDPVILRANVERFGCGPRLKTVRMDTSREGHRLLEIVPPESVRIAHIDGGHDYEVVRRDIEVTRRMIGPGAALVFDDFFNRRHPGTTQAIMEFLLSTPRIAPFMITGKKLWTCDASRHLDYVRRMKSVLVTSRKTELFQRMVLVVD